MDATWRYAYVVTSVATTHLKLFQETKDDEGTHLCCYTSFTSIQAVPSISFGSGDGRMESGQRGRTPKVEARTEDASTILPFREVC